MEGREKKGDMVETEKERRKSEYEEVREGKGKEEEKDVYGKWRNSEIISKLKENFRANIPNVIHYAVAL
jgi:hypothetical protein